MATNVYDFRPGRSLKNVNPQEIGEELDRIRADKGKLVPADVLEAAIDENSPLHHAFEWDDSAAAKQHRLNQARRLITSIRVLNSPTGRPETAYVSVKTPDRGRSFEPITEALSNEELKARVLMEVKNFIEAQQRRYSHFVEVAAALEALKKQVG